MGETHTSFCRICEALCGLEVDVEGDRIVDIRPDKLHVATDGYACLKGLRQHKMYDSPDRLLYPMRRTDGGDHERVSWDEALRDIGQTVKRIRREHGPDSIAMYVGTAAGFGVLHPVFAQGFMDGVGSRSMYASASQDCANKFAVAREVYGFPFTQPHPDLEHTECLIVVGANPAISKWSFLQVSNPIKRLKEIGEHGGKIFVVDPRRTETAKVAGEHVFIRPNTDVFFYLAFLRELAATGGVDRGKVDAHMSGLDDVLALAEPWTPERAAEVTGIAPDVLRRMVAAYRDADGAALYSSTGVNMGGRGALAFWIQEVINAASGNLDRRGGTLVGRGIIDFPKFGVKNGVLMKDDPSRIGGFTKVNDAFPGGVLADEILTPGDRQVKALFVTGGNPLLMMANAGRLKRAFESLELLVVLDIQMNETASVATHVLPCTSPFQRADLPFIFPLMLGLQRKPYLQATRALIPPQGEQRDEASIYLDLAKHSGAPLFGSRVAQAALEATRAMSPGKDLPQEALLSFLLRITGQGSFKKLLREPHGKLREDHADESFLGNRVYTDDGKVHLAPAKLVEDARRRVEEAFEWEKTNRHRLRLITKRAITTHNSWTHNITDFVEREQGTNHLYMHPDDARARGLEDGALADVASATATVRIPVRYLADLMPGTVAMPHGWGHQHAKGMNVANKTRGVNVNLLAADGPDAIEPVSGMAHLTGIPVDVTPAAGPLCERDWSGISPEERGASCAGAAAE